MKSYAHRFCLRASCCRDRGHVMSRYVVACCSSVNTIPFDIWKCEDGSVQNCNFMWLL